MVQHNTGRRRVFPEDPKGHVRLVTLPAPAMAEPIRIIYPEPQPEPEPGPELEPVRRPEPKSEAGPLDDATDLWDDPEYGEEDPAIDATPEPDSGGCDPARPIGPGNPPRQSTWQKGCRSPNAKGRPVKFRQGLLAERLDRIMPGTDMTVLEAIHQKISADALKLKRAAMKLREERKIRDALIEQRHAAYTRYQEELRRPQQGRSDGRPAHHEPLLKYEILHKFLGRIDELLPGLTDAIGQLERMGAVIRDENGDYGVAPDLLPFLQR